MAEKTEYKIHYGEYTGDHITHITKSQAQISELLNNGYTPLGGPVIAPPIICQALTRKVTVTDPSQAIPTPVFRTVLDPQTGSPRQRR